MRKPSTGIIVGLAVVLIVTLTTQNSVAASLPPVIYYVSPLNRSSSTYFYIYGAHFGTSPLTATVSRSLYGCSLLPVSFLFRINPSNGAAIPIGSMKIVFGCNALAFSPSGVLYAAGENATGHTALFTVNTSTGAATLVGPVARGSTCGVKSQPNDISDMDFSPSGKLYVIFDQTPICLATLDPSTAAETDIGKTGTLGFGNSLAISSSNVFYHTSGLAPPLLFTLNPSTGHNATDGVKMSVSGGFPSGCSATSRVIDMKFSHAGILYGLLKCGLLLGPEYLVTVNTSTGKMTIVGTSLLLRTINGLAFSPVFSPANGFTGVDTVEGFGPSLGIADINQGWSAGGLYLSPVTVDGFTFSGYDQIGVLGLTWSDSLITLTGLGSALPAGGFHIHSGDKLLVVVFAPGGTVYALTSYTGPSF
jgi:hypothetical protein